MIEIKKVKNIEERGITSKAKVVNIYSNGCLVKVINIDTLPFNIMVPKENDEVLVENNIEISHCYNSSSNIETLLCEYKGKEAACVSLFVSKNNQLINIY